MGQDQARIIREEILMTSKEILIEPMTRLEGHLGVQATADLEKKVYTDAHSFITMFRGWEII